MSNRITHTEANDIARRLCEIAMMIASAPDTMHGDGAAREHLRDGVGMARGVVTDLDRIIARTR